MADDAHEERFRQPEAILEGLARMLAAQHAMHERQDAINERLTLAIERMDRPRAQQALDTYHPEAVAGTATATDTAQLHALIQAESAQMTREVTAAVTETVTETLLAKLPELVQATVSSHGSAPERAPGTATATHHVPRGQRKLTPRQASTLRAKRASGAPIKALMQDYGLSKASVFRSLKPQPKTRPRPRKAAPVD